MGHKLRGYDLAVGEEQKVSSVEVLGVPQNSVTYTSLHEEINKRGKKNNNNHQTGCEIAERSIQ